MPSDTLSFRRTDARSLTIAIVAALVGHGVLLLAFVLDRAPETVPEIIDPPVLPVYLMPRKPEKVRPVHVAAASSRHVREASPVTADTSAPSSVPETPAPHTLTPQTAMVQALQTLQACRDQPGKMRQNPCLTAAMAARPLGPDPQARKYWAKQLAKQDAYERYMRTDYGPEYWGIIVQPFGQHIDHEVHLKGERHEELKDPYAEVDFRLGNTQDH